MNERAQVATLTDTGSLVYGIASQNLAEACAIFHVALTVRDTHRKTDKNTSAIISNQCFSDIHEHPTESLSTARAMSRECVWYVRSLSLRAFLHLNCTVHWSSAGEWCNHQRNAAIATKIAAVIFLKPLPLPTKPVGLGPELQLVGGNQAQQSDFPGLEAEMTIESCYIT